MNRSIVVGGLAVALAATTGPIVTTATAAPRQVRAASTKAAPHTSVVRESNGYYITTYTARNGDVTKVYAATPVVIHPARQHTSSIVVRGKRRVLHRGGTRIRPLQGSGAAPTGAAPTAYRELLAMGVDRKAAAKFRHTGTTKTRGHARSSASSAGRPAAIHRTGSQYGAPVCITQTFDNYSGTPPSGQPQNKGSVNGCDITYVNKKTTSVWYEQDDFQASGAMHDPTCVASCDHFTGLRFGVTWPSGNTVQSWRPSTTKSEGSCTTETVGLAYQGASVSESSTECPETWGYYSGGGNTDFSSKWDGQGGGPSNGSRDTIGVTGVYSPVGHGHQAGAYDRYWWTS